MSHIEINNSDIPIRLFKSNFLEFFTHIHPLTVIIIWVPVIVVLIWAGIVSRIAGSSFWLLPLAYIAGIFIWSFAEYMLHRFMFHYRPKNPRQERIIFMFHGVHHAQPQCKTRLVMPPIVSVPMSLLFYGLFSLILGVVFKVQYLVNPLSAGFVTGYLVYDLTHYATHHLTMRGPVLKYLKRYHMQHHYKTPDARYGVSSPLWDIVFKTKPS